MNKHRLLWPIIVGIILVQCQSEQVGDETKQPLLTLAPTEQQNVMATNTSTKPVSTEQIDVAPARPVGTPVPNFTYLTNKGSIWQVNINGQKIQLIPDDGIEKKLLSWSPDRQRLAYVIREWPQNDEEETPLLQESLVVVEADTLNSRQLAGPVAAITYSWIDDQTVNLQLADELSDGSKRQQWDYFVLDVDTGEKTQLEQPEWSPTPDFSSPDNQWSFEFEEKANKRFAYLLDVNGNKVDTIYERPAEERWPLVWSPDSRYILYYSSSGKWDIYVYDLVTREHKHVTKFSAEPDGHVAILNISWGPIEGIILIRRQTDQYYEEPCLINILNEHLQCFGISAMTGQYVWSVDGHYLGFVAPRGGENVDVYAIELSSSELLNLTRDGNQIIEDRIAP